jgi:hypothetical protein
MQRDRCQKVEQDNLVAMERPKSTSKLDGTKTMSPYTIPQKETVKNTVQRVSHATKANAP